MRKVLLAALFVVFGVQSAFADWSSPLSPAAGRILHQAQVLMEKGDDAEAGRLLAEYVDGQKNPHPLGSLLYGNWLMEHDRLDAAADVYADAFRREPKSTELALNLGVARFRQKRFEDAGGLFLKASELSEKPRPGWQFHAAACYFEAENPQKTCDILRPLLERSCVKPGWVRLMAHSYIALEKWAEAEGVLIRFLRQQPEAEKYWQLLANVRVQRKHYPEAAAALEIAFRLKTPTQSERESLSNIYMFIGAPLMASRVLEADPSRQISPEVCDNMTRAYLLAGRRDDALRMLGKAIEREETGARWLEKGRILFSARRYDAAADALGEAIRLKEKTGLAYYLLGLTEWQRQNWDAARESFNLARQCKRYRRPATQALASLESLRRVNG